MKTLSITLLILCAFFAGKAQSQNNLIVYTEPKEVSDVTAGPKEAKIIIITPNKEVAVSHTMGHEKGVFTGREKTGEYRFELTHPFSEDEQEDGFSKTTLTVSTPQGSKTSQLTLKPGKCYIGRFEIPLSFSYVDESNLKGVYAEENRAKVSFFSDIDDLTIKFNGKPVISNGKPDASSLEYVQASVNKDKEHDGQWTYDLIFDTANPAAQSSAFKNPTFTVKSSFPDELNIQLKEGNQLTVKRMYKFRILLQLVETVIQEKEVFVSDYAQFLANAEESEKNLKFAAAKGFYQQAMDAADRDQTTVTEGVKETLTKKIAEMEECDKYEEKIKQYMALIKKLRTEGKGGTVKEVEDAFRQALICYSNLDALHPAPKYKNMIDKIEKVLEGFNFFIIEGSVRDRKDNTKLIGEVGIYGVSSSTFTDDMEKKAKGIFLGKVAADGKFRIKVDKGKYNGLLFVPAGAGGYKKNGFVSVKEQKHLKTTVYLYK